MNANEILIVLVFFGAKIKQDYQHDSSFLSWYPIKTAACELCWLESALNSYSIPGWS